MSNKVLANLPNCTDTCGCSLMDGRCVTHREMMIEIHNVWQSGTAEACEILWSMSDGYGFVGYVPDQGYDWSGIRDSTTDAIENMWKAIHA